VDEIIAMVDQDNDNRISYKEFLEFFI